MSNERQPSEQEHGNQPQLEPEIYVACLAAYNSGQLHGRWINASQGPDELQTAVEEMLAASPEPGADEWAIHDFAGFGVLRLSEHEDLFLVSQIADGIALHGPAFAAWAAHLGREQWDDLYLFEDHYLGHWESLTAYAEELFDEIGVERAVEKVAGSLAPYVRLDAEGLGRDLVLSGDFVAAEAPDGGVFLFHS